MQENKKDLKGQQNLGSERQGQENLQSDSQKGIQNPQRENVSLDEDLDEDSTTQRSSQSGSQSDRSGNQQQTNKNLGSDKSDRRL